ncbi:MAG: hypothetical protein RR140_02125 [Clostridia bacterium]
MKKFGLMFCTIILSAVLIFGGCAEKPLEQVPNNAIIVGNGGTSVVIGDYIYYANNFETSLTADIVEGKKTGLLNRIKTINGKIETKETNPQNIENVNKVFVGYGATNMFISGRKLFFTTPNTLKTDKGETAYDRVCIYKTDLNGNNLTKMYTAEGNLAKVYFTTVNGKDYAIVKDDKKLSRIELSNFKTVQISDKCAEIVFEQNSNYLFFTTARTDKNTGNILNKYEISTNLSAIKSEVIGKTIVLISQSHDELFYSEGTQTNSSNFEDNQPQKHISATTITNPTWLGKNRYNEKLQVAFIFETNLYFKPYTLSQIENDYKIPTTECGTPTNIIFEDGTWVYFITNSGLWRVRVGTADDNGKNFVIEQITAKTITNVNNIDFNGDHAYFFAKVEKDSTNAEYMHRVCVNRTSQALKQTELIACLSKESTESIEKSK